MGIVVLRERCFGASEPYFSFSCHLSGIQFTEFSVHTNVQLSS